MRRRKNKYKIGKHTSKYRLFVDFLPIYQTTRKDFNYNSDDRKGTEIGLQKLMNKVLHGTCKNRYKRALLYDNDTGVCIKAFLPNHGEVDLETYRSIWYENTIRENTIQTNIQKSPLLKAFVVCFSRYVTVLLQEKKRHPVILESIDFDKEKRIRGMDVSVFHLRKMLTEGTLSGRYKIAILYRQSDNQKVGLIDPRSYLTFICKDFEKEILKSTHYPLHQLGVFR